MPNTQALTLQLGETETFNDMQITDANGNILTGLIDARVVIPMTTNSGVIAQSAPGNNTISVTATGVGTATLYCEYNGAQLGDGVVVTVVPPIPVAVTWGGAQPEALTPISS